MYVYLQAYQPGAETVNPVQAFVTFYRNSSKAFETKPLTAVEPTASRLKTVPLHFSFPLDQLDPGEYLCQVTVVDANQRKAAFWQTQVMIVP